VNSGKFKQFIPCVGGRCPSRMQLIIRDGQGEYFDTPYYRCLRDEGFDRCHYSYDENGIGIDRIGVERWVRHCDKRYHLKEGDKPTAKDMETMI